MCCDTAFMTKPPKFDGILFTIPHCYPFNPQIQQTNSHFESKELKMLRVAISSFFDYLKVVLKCFQEFDTTITADTTDATDVAVTATTNNDAVAPGVATNCN
jgi:hypothetical protein